MSAPETVVVEHNLSATRSLQAMEHKVEILFPLQNGPRGGGAVAWTGINDTRSIFLPGVPVVFPVLGGIDGGVY